MCTAFGDTCSWKGRKVGKFNVKLESVCDSWEATIDVGKVNRS